MKYFYPTLHAKHNPKYDYSDGLPPFKYMESVDRFEEILKGVLKHVKKEDIIQIDELIDLKEVYKIHDKEYISFLFDLCEDLEDEEEYIPSMFRENLANAPIRFKGGMYSKEVGTPLQKESIKAILNSANVAFCGAKYLHKSNENVFALTRPPGHHSGYKTYGGYGFINNAMLGAKYFLDNGLKPVVLDVDYHIGDGSAELSQRFGVEYFSIHIDPWRNYPYLTKDISFSKNIHLTHLKHNTSKKEYFKKLRVILKEIKSMKKDVLMLSLGFDTLKSDYCQDEAILIKNSDFYDLGREIKSLTCKLMICLEGGYDKENISEAMDFFLKGLGV